MISNLSFYLSSSKAFIIDFCLFEYTFKKLSAFITAVLWYSNVECLSKTYYYKIHKLKYYLLPYSFIAKLINSNTSLAFFQLLNAIKDRNPNFWLPTPPHLAKTTQNLQNTPFFASEYNSQL